MFAMMVGLSACNRAPVDYLDLGTARRADAAWGGPTDTVCDRFEPGDDDLVIHGFTLCKRDNDILPIDDPLFTPCGEAVLDGPILYVYDGVRVRGYVEAALIGRELVHDRFGDDPVLVDY